MRRPPGREVHEHDETVLDDDLAYERTRRVETVDEPARFPDERPVSERHVSVRHEVGGPSLAARKAQQAVWFFFGVLETLLALRLLLFAMAANPANPFFAFVDALTAPLVAPFANLVASPRVGSAVLELGTAFAMLMYLLLAVGVAKLFDLLFSRDHAH